MDKGKCFNVLLFSIELDLHVFFEIISEISKLIVTLRKSYEAHKVYKT